LQSANILLDSTYKAIICDFGLSRIKTQEDHGIMTQNCGTFQWMAPEVLAKERYNEKCDVFSYSIILWELLTGKCPYYGKIPCLLSIVHNNERPVIPPWCPPALQGLIRSCGQREPEKRPSFLQIIGALESANELQKFVNFM
jgi:serine/threonine protein kinase